MKQLEKSRRTIIIAALSLCFTHVSHTRATPIIQNGSFEINTATLGAGWTGAPNELGANPEDASSASVDSWLRSGRAWLYGNRGGADETNFSAGDWAVALDARSDLSGIDVLAQTGLSLVAGSLYTLTFDMWGMGVATTEALDVRFTFGFSDALVHTDGTGVTVLDEKTTVGNDGFFESVTVNFTPSVTDANYGLQFFMDGTGENNNHVYIDNVVLSIPEPSTLALLGIGAFLMRFIRRRRS